MGGREGGLSEPPEPPLDLPLMLAGYTPGTKYIGGI